MGGFDTQMKGYIMNGAIGQFSLYIWNIPSII
jgi:hypothetical protein